MYLVDTNIWLERLLDQARSDEVRRFLDSTPAENLFISDFSFHSIAIIMLRLKRVDQLIGFVRDVFIDGGVGLVHLQPKDTAFIVQAAARFNLDFDDAYQYAVAEIQGLAILSFDNDFDRTDRGRKEPLDIPEHA